MPHIQVFAGHSTSEEDLRPPSAKVHGYVAESEVHETLRQIGLEYKTADYFPHRQTVIVIDPDPDILGVLPPSAREQINNLRAALIASGVKEGLVDAIQNAR